MTAVSQPSKRTKAAYSSVGSGRKLRLPYNAKFLPEYLSTVVLSVLISWFFLANLNARAWGGQQALHVSLATVGYALMAICLLWLTWQYRVWYSDVLFLRDAEGRVKIRVGRVWMELHDLEALEETIGSFFGRATRILQARNSDNGTFEVNECLSGFDELKKILGRLCDVDVDSADRRVIEELESIKDRWHRRHRLFPVDYTFVDMTGRLVFRLLCLLPVAVVDVAINAALNVLLQNAGREALVVYVAPLSLLVSAAIARFVYYYLFTSTRLNKRIG